VGHGINYDYVTTLRTRMPFDRLEKVEEPKSAIDNRKEAKRIYTGKEPNFADERRSNLFG
jgi:hypothetical protein